MATTHDAEIILKLYELRTEAVMRKARHFIALEYWPANFEQLNKEVLSPWGSEKNDWFRQVFGYWEMAAAIALRGAVDEGLFYDAAGELLFLYGKYEPYMAEVRKLSATFMLNMEKFVHSKPEYQQRLETVRGLIAKRMAANTSR